MTTQPFSIGQSFVLLLVFWSATISVSKTAQAQVDAVVVQRSIDRGISYLRSTQNDRGGWQELPRNRCGISSLCTLAMLSSGVPTNDPAIVKALKYLRSFQLGQGYSGNLQTYSISLQTMVFCQAGAIVDLPKIRQNVEWLVQKQRADGQWDYGNTGSGDPSNSQFALLALGAAADRGIEINPKVFQGALEFWESAQKNVGGWSYTPANPNPTGSMTCAGIASVLIARSHLGNVNGTFTSDDIECCGQDLGQQDAAEKGLQYLGKVFSTTVNPGDGSSRYYYYMYALERVGRLSGRRFIGQHDWYREGAANLLKLQDDLQGYWSGAGNSSDPNIGTAFSLLFLSKGKRQVVVAKLQYSAGSNLTATTNRLPDQDWNHHPDSLKQLVRHVEKDWRRDLTWQTIDVANASVEDLLQAPVIVISGQKTLRNQITVKQAERLKEYIDQGGTIVFEADGGEGCADAKPFWDSALRLSQYWFPDAPIEKLPQEHPVWYAEHKVDPTALDDSFWVYGVQACCRTPIFLVPSSLSCRWEHSSILQSRREISPAAKSELQAAVSIGENIIAYATGRELKNKLDQQFLLPGKSILNTVRGQFGIGELPVGAGGKDARRALPNVAAMVAQRVPMAIAATDQLVTFDDQSLENVSMLWIHGRTDFTLTNRQRESLRRFIQNGGFILANAICGSEEFSSAFRRELALIDPEMTLQSLEADASIFTKQFNGFDVTRVTVRQPVRERNSVQVNKRLSHPIIEVGRSEGIASVFFSPLDLSCALESQNSVQCPGYATDESVKIVANLILYALQQESQ